MNTIYVIKKDGGLLENCIFYTTRDLAIINLHKLADNYRNKFGFKLSNNEFSFLSESLPDDDGGWVRLPSYFTIVEVKVEE